LFDRQTTSHLKSSGDFVNPFLYIPPIAAIVVPACTLLWYLLRAEIRTQALSLQLAINDRIGSVEERVAAVEALVVRQANWQRSNPKRTYATAGGA
jgi:hypothetical protein